MYLAAGVSTKISCAVPWAAIASNIIIYKEFREYPSLNGTGFFCKLAEGNRYYYVTALHCLDANGRHKDIQDFPLLKIAYEVGVKDFHVSDDVRFEFVSNVAHGSEEKPGTHEDLLVYVVDPNLSSTQAEILQGRALVVRHPSWYVDFFKRANNNTALRVIGYPKDSTTICGIEDGKAKIQRRFLHGKFSNSSPYADRMAIENTNWKGSEIVGFSGSPVLHFEKKWFGLESIPVGVVLTGNSKRIEFLDMARVADVMLHIEQGHHESGCEFRYSSEPLC